MKLLIFGLIVLIACAAMFAVMLDKARADIIYVNSIASGSDNGTSWNDAYVNLQEALTTSGTPCQIRVAAGTYTPAPPGEPGTRSDSFQMKNGVGLYGGFPNTGSPTWNERDWETYETILSGEIGNPGTRIDNCYHVVYYNKVWDSQEDPWDERKSPLDGYLEIDGFIITGGYANGTQIDGFGGGMYLESDIIPSIANCVLTENYAYIGGGGLYSNSEVLISKCTFYQNSVCWGGGGLRCDEDITITDCTFVGNSAIEDGGGAYLLLVNDGNVSVTNCVFYGNFAKYGGGLKFHCNDALASTISNSIFWDNTGGELTWSLLNSPPNYAAITYCNIKDGSGEPWFGPGCVNTDPLWVNPGSGDFHLQPTSPCIDAGINGAPQGLAESDIDGEDRIMDGDSDGFFRVDMGVDEFSGVSGYVYPPEVWVDDDWQGSIPGQSVGSRTFMYDAYDNIAEGIYSVALGGTVHVASGTYTENIVWQRNASVLGTERPMIKSCDFGLAIITRYLDNDARLDGFLMSGTNCSICPGMRNDNSSPTITNCTFSDHDGGGMSNNWISSPLISNCTFSDNNSYYNGAGMANEVLCSPVLNNCKFTNNHVNEGYGGGVSNEERCSPTFVNCLFSGNSADQFGGGMYNSNSSPTLLNCVFSTNSVPDPGGLAGGMCIVEGTPTLINCVFFDNSAHSKGGGLWVGDSNPEITNCTFFSNTVGSGGGMYCSDYASPILTNCILWENSAEEIFVQSGTPIITYSNIDKGTGQPWFGTGCVDVDPQWVNPGSGDFHLQANSPCIDSGSNSAAPATDFEGDARPFDGDYDGSAIADMGVDEYGVKVGVYVTLQGDNRPIDGWEVPITVGFFEPGADVLSATPVQSFTGHTIMVVNGTTRAYFECPQSVAPGTYDITADITTTLMNVKRLVGIW